MAAKKKTSAAHNYIEDFKAVLAGYQEDGDLLTADAAGAMDRITDFYGLTTLQVFILAAILVNGRCNLSLEEVMRHIRKEDSMGVAFHDLIAMRILHICESNTAGRRLCACDYIRDCFKKGEPLPYPCLRSAAEELAHTTLEELCSYDTIICLEPFLTEKAAKALDDLSVPQAPEAEAFAFWALCHQMVHHFTAPFVLERAAPYLKNPDCDGGKLRLGLMSLVKLGAAMTVPAEEDHDGDKGVTLGFILTPSLAGLVFHGEDRIVRYDGISRFATVIKHTEIEPKKLYFSEQSQEEIDHLRKILSRRGYGRAVRILKSQKRNPSIQSLFFGPSGTGKTEVVRQLARETKRDIILFDTAKLTFSAWGSTEKAFRSLFSCYRYIAEVSGHTPILMMNEADQLLGGRIQGIDCSMDKSQNIVTDILLEELENMKGILLATTNLKGNIDKAFDRRFLFRTELTEPDAEARVLIWKSLLKKFPDTDARALAYEYKMSGAQISNVVTKRELAELYYTGDRGLEYIRGLCEQELSSAKGRGNDRVRVGF